MESCSTNSIGMQGVRSSVPAISVRASHPDRRHPITAMLLRWHTVTDKGASISTNESWSYPGYIPKQQQNCKNTTKGYSVDHCGATVTNKTGRVSKLRTPAAEKSANTPNNWIEDFTKTAEIGKPPGRKTNIQRSRNIKSSIFITTTKCTIISCYLFYKKA